ncbi:MAG: oligosaccharide flippase family protein [Verrucomicrobiota bacterium]
MSRLKNFTRSLLSGYLCQGVNILYTLASVSLALHYLSIKEFGLWTLVTTVANFNMIFMDLGMSGSLARILIDHKDDRSSPAYGSVIQTGVLVLLVQGCLMALVGSVISIWLPQWMAVPENFQPVFRLLMIFQCVLLGATYAGRVFSFILSAHQRYDMCNYASMGGFAFNLLVLWLGFKYQLGLYSLFAALSAGSIFSIIFSGWAVCHLGFLPAKKLWGRPSRAAFHELFFYGTDLFLLVIGQQLIAASAVPVISRTLGLEAAAVWGIATKVFTLAQQIVGRILDVSSGALAEMMVRGERERLKKRFGDIVVLTGTAAAACAIMVALCNASFLKIWTHGRIAWSPENNVLMAISFFIYLTVRLSIGLVGITKRIGAMKFIYIFEGTAFVLLGLLLAPHWGFAGVIVSGIATDLLFSGVYGARRVSHYFDISYAAMFENWCFRPMVFLCVSSVAAFGVWFITRQLNAPTQLAISVSVFGMVMLFLLWRAGLPRHLRNEIAERVKDRIYGFKKV